MQFGLEVEREDDGRWLAEARKLPGVFAYGATRDEALRRVEVLALCVLSEQLTSKICKRHYTQF